MTTADPSSNLQETMPAQSGTWSPRQQTPTAEARAAAYLFDRAPVEVAQQQRAPIEKPQANADANHAWRNAWPSSEETQGRAILLTQEMIEASSRICARMTHWVRGMKSLAALAQRFPAWDAEAVLLKVVAVNAFCGPHVLSRYQAATHIERVMRKIDTQVAGAEAVETIADIPTGAKDGATRKQHSFASKFAHAFINPDRFPMLDNYSIRVLRMHLGPRSWIPKEDLRYVEFEGNFRRLRGLCGYEGKRRHLSRYLWISGQVSEFCRNRRARISPELKSLLTSPDADLASDLKRMAPDVNIGTPWL